MTAHTVPHTYMAAYSAIPLRVESDNVDVLDNVKYNILITWDQTGTLSPTPINIDNRVMTLIPFSTPHNYRAGETVFIDSAEYTGFYNIITTPDNLSIVIDLEMGVPITTGVLVNRTFQYKMSPDLQGEAKLDLSNTIKDFVSYNFEDVNEIFSGSNTRFTFDVTVGEESNYVLRFEDNTTNIETPPTVGNNVAFFNTSITSLTGIPFQVGDSIEIEQDLFEWQYYDNGFYNGKLGFSGTTVHNFLPGQIVTVTGQETYPYYNGPVGVNTASVTDSNILTTDKNTIGATPVEGGSIFGVPRPSYNTVAEITAIYIETTFGLGLVIETNQKHKGSTQPIPGNIKFADDRITATYNIVAETNINAFNSHINRLDYTVDGFDKYVIQKRSAIENNFSTILENDTVQTYRIEKSTKSWLLAHVYSDDYTDRARYYFFDKSGAILSISELTNQSGNNLDYYVPVGIDQLLASSNLTTYAGSDLSAITESIDSYSVSIFAGSTNRCSYVKFEINDDCSRYELYHLMWKDRLGSWLSYPFKYVSKDETEFERKSYYKKEGKFDLENDTFGYDSFGRGETTYYGRSRDKIVLNSGWVEEHENVLIKDLLQSTEVYVQTPDNTLIGCTVDNKSFEFMKEENVDIFQYNLNVRLSSNETRY